MKNSRVVITHRSLLIRSVFSSPSQSRSCNKYSQIFFSAENFSIVLSCCCRLYLTSLWNSIFLSFRINKNYSTSEQIFSSYKVQRKKRSFVRSSGRVDIRFVKLHCWNCIVLRVMISLVKYQVKKLLTNILIINIFFWLANFHRKIGFSNSGLFVN